MGIYNKISSTAMDDIQIEAGMLLNTFNPASPTEPQDEDIICATTGGVSVSCVPSFSDYGEDIDNVPNNVLELKRIDGWDCKFSTTCLGVTADTIGLALSAYTKTTSGGVNKILPNRDLASTDFEDALWWVGERADGGLVAVKIKNALSTGGFSLKTTKNGKGQLTLELTGHVSLSAQQDVPMEFYTIDADGGNVHLTQKEIDLTVGGTATLTAVVRPAGTTVTWASDKTTVATVSSGTVTAVSAGSAMITASITTGGHTYTDRCFVVVKSA